MRLSLPLVGDGRVVEAAPPLRFRPIFGDIRSAWPCESGPFANVKKIYGTAAQKNGKRYEKKVLEKLTDLFGSSFFPGHWLRFHDASGLRYCQVDGLLHSERLTAIFEVKYSFTSDGWWQLRRLYEPVIRRAYKPSRLALVLICRNFDGGVPFPEPFRIVPPVFDESGAFGAPDWAGDCEQISVIPWRL